MKVLAIVGLVVLCVALMLGVNALLAWGAQYVLAAFNVHANFWVCFVAILVIGAIFGRASRS